MAIYMWRESQEPSSILFYYPFKNDLRDISGNGYDLSASGSDYSFTTNSEGIGCVQLNSNGQSTYFYRSSSYPTITMGNNNSFTLGFYVCNSYAGSLSSGGYSAPILCLSSTYKIGINQSSGDFGTVAFREIANNGTIGTNIRTPVTGNNFTKVVYIFDGVNNKAQGYANGTLIYEVTGISGYRNNQNQFIVGRDTYSNDWPRRLKAKICNVVGSPYARGEDEIERFNSLES